jgi:hypothetical protein
MKKSIPLFYGILILFGLFLSGCTEKTDDTTNTANRSSYLGRWNVSESTKISTYEVNITADPNSGDGVFISNFGNLGWSVDPAGATVSGNSIILDANQVIANMTINGSGSLSGTKINWNYTLNTGADLFTVVAVYTKQ